MRHSHLVLNAKAFALPGALSHLHPSDNDAQRLADLGAIRAADGTLYVAPQDQDRLPAAPKQAA